MANCLHWLKRNSTRLLPWIEGSRRSNDLTKLKMAVVLLRAQTNRFEHLRPLATELLEKLSGASAGELIIIGS